MNPTEEVRTIRQITLNDYLAGMRGKKFKFLFLILCFCACVHGKAQTVLTLKAAIRAGLENYESIKARSNYLKAAEQNLALSRREYVPNLTLAAQQDYGTVNGQNGPLYGFNGLGVASSGLPLPNQNWNAGFGALYLANMNWEFFNFGRTAERIKIAGSAYKLEESNLEQEKFQHQIKIAGAYLNLLAAHYIAKSQQRNLERAGTVRKMTVARAANGLLAGVDTSTVNSEVSSAKIAYVKALTGEQEQSSRLAVLMGVSPETFVLDSTFITKIPALSPSDSISEKNHPVLKYYQGKVSLSEEELKLSRRARYPSFLFFGVIQTRGSGFTAGYTQNQTLYTREYAEGVKPTRGNYLLGVGMNWNLTGIYRGNAQIGSQRFKLQAIQNEYDLVQRQLMAESLLSDQRINNAMENYNEVPTQMKAASDAYLQKSALFKNGLATMVDVTQALYALNRAETDRDVAYINVWQALLLKAAAVGDITLFTNEF